MLDLHCHILPGVDDGPATIEQSVQLAKLLVLQGVDRVIATPHQLVEGPNPVVSRANIQTLVTQLQSLLDQQRIPLQIHPGGEVRAVDDLLQQMNAGNALTLGDQGRFVLLELPFHQPLPPRGVVQQLHQQGLGVILAHPERYSYALHDKRFLDDWSNAKAMFQVNASSLTGDHGKSVQQLAISLIRRGMVHFVASDAHGPDRPPRIAKAKTLLDHIFPKVVSDQLCVENPDQLLSSPNAAAQSLIP